MALQISTEEAATSSVRPERPAMPLEKLVTYYRDVFFTTVALKKRFDELKDRATFREVDGYQQMVKEYAAAINET